MHTQVPLTRITRAHTCAVLAAAPTVSGSTDNNTHLTCLCPFLPVFCSPGGEKQAAKAGPPEASALSEYLPLSVFVPVPVPVLGGTVTKT
jgi:hypothetical protein